MWSSDSEAELAARAGAATTTTASSSSLPSSPHPRRRRHRRRGRKSSAVTAGDEVDAEDVWRGAQWEAAWPRHPKPVVLAEDTTGGGGAGASSSGGGDGVGHARSLTDDDLEELKGCVDLGFGFSYDEIPELCGTLPALELCYSMSQRFLDEHHHHPQPQSQTPPETATPPPIANWKISSPGDSPDEVKARLKYWAQAVACTVRLCRSNRLADMVKRAGGCFFSGISSHRVAVMDRLIEVRLGWHLEILA